MKTGALIRWSARAGACLAEADPAPLDGYGRAELHPASDIDLLILVPPERDEFLAETISSFITLLWDIGLCVGQSVRTVKECIEHARDDISIATNLLEARHLAGDHGLFEAMIEGTSPERIWPTDVFFAAKMQEQKERHLKYDDTAHNLEPNIKEGPGGLRDIQMIGWIAKRYFGTETFRALIDHGFLTEKEYQALVFGEEHLWSIRFALHILTGREEDRILFDYQRTLAEQFIRWLGRALQGDLGNSFAQANFASFVGADSGVRTTVAQQIAPRFANTMFLAGVTAAIAVPAAGSTAPTDTTPGFAESEIG